MHQAQTSMLELAMLAEAKMYHVRQLDASPSYSASRKAPVMQVKANLPKRKPAAALTVSPRRLHGPGFAPRLHWSAHVSTGEWFTSACSQSWSCSAYTSAPERYPPATSAEDSAGSHRCCRSADLADSRATRQTRRYQARRIFGPSQEWCVLSNG